MTRAEKVMALEALWEDLSRNDAEFESPDWHREELAATQERVKSGLERFVDWAITSSIPCFLTSTACACTAVFIQFIGVFTACFPNVSLMPFTIG